MTHEEAKEIVKRIKGYMGDGECWSESEFMAMDMAIKALSQEPCTDAVSRESVLGAICDYVAFEEYEDKSHTFTIRPLTKRIKQLPSVNPQPCDDAISRQAVLDIVNNPLNIRLDEIIKKLPSVTQKSETVTEFADRCRECGAKYGKLLKQKSGKWIQDIYEQGKYFCSECDEEIKNIPTVMGKPIINFCPNCGAKMESEEQTE